MANMLLSVLRKAFKWSVIILIFICSINYWLNNKSYVFDEKSIAAISRKHVDNALNKNISYAYSKVLADLRAKYAGHILPDDGLQWVFMNAGGWMGSMCLLHASLTEYVLFFGTAVDTSGHSGRYWANISDTILTGNFYQWQEGALNRVVYKPGDTVFHGVGEATAVSWTSGTWMVEYGRGFIPSTLFFALADSITSTTDFITVFYIFRVYMKAMWQEVLFYAGDFSSIVKQNL
ncbi:sigma non-opioid intracellular receptor 1-like [Physella acuta]|uniref:sigma non-opioid intracellular receptor 1-like n=1 Tax=Physella acuta TaxID=109671 RepID=UPI0027DB4E33|nr:sigma non-opioid intracellular receptor 1-like [Physella acuta]